MSMPQHTDQYILKSKGGFDSLELEKNVSLPQLGDYDCLIEIHAVSLNYRDLIITKDQYPFPVKIPLIPCSDASGKVLAVGSRVTEFKTGDEVCTLFNTLHQGGSMTPRILGSGLGGAIDGTLRKHANFPEHALVHAPNKVTAVEASTLPCAPVTAWNALYGLVSKALKPGQWVLTQGTGGVSIAAIQFALAAGANVIATTSSQPKADKLKQLGVKHVINYTETKEWGKAAKVLTPGEEGVDHVVEIGGPNTMAQSLEAVKMEGVISVIGFLAKSGDDGEKEPSTLETLSHCCIIRGILVGSKLQFNDMNAAIDANGIKPIVDKVFAFDRAKEAYQYLWDQKHVGKVVIQVA